MLEQPGVQVAAALEAGKTMITEHEEHGLRIDVIHRQADQPIGAPIKVLDRSAVRTAAILLGEEHVLHAVGGVKHAGHHAAAAAFQGTEEHPLAFLIRQPGLLQEGIGVDGVLVERPCVLGHSQSGVCAQQFGQVSGITGGVRNR
jgi:hypothetical protein